MTLTNYIRQNWLPITMVFVPAGLFLGPLPHSSAVYYGLLIILAGLAFIKNKKTSSAALFFLMVCALSIVCGNADPLFRPWERLGLFAFLLAAYFPVFQSDYFDRLRAKIFPLMLYVMVFTSVGSFIGYFGGINYMNRFDASPYSIDTVGWFGGLTKHSMMLSPICALSLTILAWYFIERSKTKKERVIVACAAFASFCCMLLTASRGGNAAGVAGVILVLFLKYRSRIGKILQIGIIGIALAAILSPIYMPFADKVMSKQHTNEEAGSTFSSRESHWEHRMEEFSEYPVLGYGFCAIDTDNIGEYMPSTGIVEPGSSWLAVLSMTGLAGMTCFVILLYSTITRLYRNLKRETDPWALLHLGILTVFSVHFIAEGYVFSGGGALCFLFWFFFGCAYSYARNPISY